MPGILLTVRGKALEAGAVGDVVSVLNIQSNRTVQATVIGPGRVSHRRRRARCVPAAAGRRPQRPRKLADSHPVSVNTTMQFASRCSSLSVARRR